MLEVTRLPLETQTAYAELLSDLLRHRHEGRTASVVEKVIHGRRYLYVQERALGKMLQTYLGPDTTENRARANELKAGWSRAREGQDRRSTLVKLARVGGCACPTAAELNVLATLADGGVFGIGGVLVGTHAFAVLTNALGVTAEAGALRTSDIDLVHDPRILVAVEHATPPVLPQLQRDAAGPVHLWPIPGFDPRTASTSFKIHGTQLHLDLLTPLRGRSEEPIEIPALGASALPLRYLDYLVEESLPAAVVGGTGVLVNVPDPARFAVHKLIVAELRPAMFATKSRKDLLQAEALLRVLLTDRPADVTAAWNAMLARGKGWAQRARRTLRKLAPEVAARVASS